MEQDADGQMTFDFGRTADRIQINAEKSVTLKATDGGGGASTGLYMLPVYVLNGAAIGRTGKNGGNQLGIMQEDTAPTLTTADRHAVCVPDKGILKNIVRRLTPLECERLDGFPDGWTQKRKDGREISDNARYIALGNSIAVPCAARVFRGIIAAEMEVVAVAERSND